MKIIFLLLLRHDIKYFAKNDQHFMDKVLKQHEF